MARRGDHTLAQIKDMVLIAAEDLVAYGGLTQLRVRNIAAKIGYTVGSIYMVFQSMDELMLHIKGRTVDSITAMMDEIDEESPELHLEALATIYIRYASENLNRWSMVFEHRLPEGVSTPDWYEQKLDTLYSHFEQQFERLAPELTRVEKKQATMALLGGIHGLCVLMLTTHFGTIDRMELENNVVFLIKRFIEGDWKNFIHNVSQHSSDLTMTNNNIVEQQLELAN